MADSDSSLALRAAIVAAMIADAPLTALIAGRVYNQVPGDPPYPYVSFGPEQGNPWDAQAMDGSESFIQIDCWSRQPGQDEVMSIRAAIRAALHAAVLTVAGHSLVLLDLQFQTVLPDPDGRTTHGVQRFRAVTHL